MKRDVMSRLPLWANALSPTEDPGRHRAEHTLELLLGASGKLGCYQMTPFPHWLSTVRGGISSPGHFGEEQLISEWFSGLHVQGLLHWTSYPGTSSERQRDAGPGRGSHQNTWGTVHYSCRDFRAGPGVMAQAPIAAQKSWGTWVSYL